MEVSRPMLPTLRYPSSEYYDNRSSSTRQPLGESTGNSQSPSHHPSHQYNNSSNNNHNNNNNSLGPMSLCTQNISSITSLPPQLPAPGILPTQSLDNYGSVGNLRKRRQHMLQLQRNRRDHAGVNPIYLSPQFRAYRKKQAEKESKEAQIWPDVLEDAFLDALLLIPQMGRRKFTLKGTPHGRNMLISEYLWIAYCLSLPPGEKPSNSMRRERKQVSSHIQVLKNFFIHHRAYHFFFPGKERKEERRDAVEMESFKDNPVLNALTKGNLPQERPNYDYFHQLLESNNLVTIRPSSCWILISSQSVRVETEGALCGQVFKEDGERMDPVKYPHLHLNQAREEWPKGGNVIQGALIHEYTRSVSQREASSVRDISLDWEETFPELHKPLDEVVQENLRDILHLHVTLEVQEPDQFPAASQLNSLVEITLERTALQSHKWKCITRLARPLELTSDEADPTLIVESEKEMGMIYSHRSTCPDKGRCDCLITARQRKQQWNVPFPANEWAVMLSQLAQHKKHAFDVSAVAEDDEPTQMDLVKKVAMFQELWSCPDPSQNATWTRHAVILWTFETVWQMGDKRRITKVPAGTNWRFLTAVDPTSQYHQQKALISASQSAATAAAAQQREGVMSPGPGYQQYLNASMHENFGQAWDVPPQPYHPVSSTSPHPSSQQQQQQQQQHHHHHHSTYATAANNNPLAGVLDPYGQGLSTPPPSAGLHGSYPLAPPPTFGQPHQNPHSHSHQHHALGGSQMGFMTTSSHPSSQHNVPDTSSSLAVTGHVGSDPFTASDIGVYDESNPQQSWNAAASHMANMDGSWTNQYTLSAAASQAQTPGLTWTSGASDTTKSHWAATPAEEWASHTPSPTDEHRSNINWQQQQQPRQLQLQLPHPHQLQQQQQRPMSAAAAAAQAWMDQRWPSTAGGDSTTHTPTTTTTPTPSAAAAAAAPNLLPTLPPTLPSPLHHHSGPTSSAAPRTTTTNTTITTLASPLKSLKRSRSDSMDDDRENFPLAAIPKLEHHMSAGTTGRYHQQGAQGDGQGLSGILDEDTGEDW